MAGMEVEGEGSLVRGKAKCLLRVEGEGGSVEGTMKDWRTPVESSSSRTWMSDMMAMGVVGEFNRRTSRD